MVNAKCSSQLNRQSGQMIVESVVIMLVLLTIMAVFTTTMKQNEIFSRLVVGPWQSLAGMLQNGAWGSPAQTMAFHPVFHDRRHTMIGEEAK